MGWGFGSKVTGINFQERAIEDDRYKNRRSQDVSPRTVNMDLGALRRLFAFAIKRGYAAKNPTLEIAPVADPRRSFFVLSREDEARLVAELDRPRLRHLNLTAPF